MKTQNVTIKLTKDLMTHFQLEVYAHEIPLYEAAHPDGNVQLVSVGRTIEIDTSEEYERLAKKFGDDSETGRPLVDEVYGHSGRALDTGAFEINPDLAPAAPVAKPVPTTEAKPDIDKLRETCDIVGIKRTKTMNAATLQKQIDAKYAEFAKVVADRGIEIDGLDILELKGLVDDINEEDAAA